MDQEQENQGINEAKKQDLRRLEDEKALYLKDLAQQTEARANSIKKLRRVFSALFLVLAAALGYEGYQANKKMKAIGVEFSEEVEFSCGKGQGASDDCKSTLKMRDGTTEAWKQLRNEFLGLTGLCAAFGLAVMGTTVELSRKKQRPDPEPPKL